jgi:hypothetical protein
MNLLQASWLALARLNGGFVTQFGRLYLARLLWLAAGKPIPPPPVVKQQVLLRHAERFAIVELVETGTYHGDMVDAVRREFRRIWSIELDRKLYRRAAARFERHGHISILEGDSGKLLPEILTGIAGPCLFWLDAHHSGGVTARGDRETPVVQEVAAILDHHPQRGDVVLIDDAHCFTGDGGYPTLDDLRDLILAKRPDWTFAVEDDIVRAHAAPGIEALCGGKPT